MNKWIKGLLSEDYRLELEDPNGWWHADVKWDGCIHLYRAGNVPFNTDFGLAGGDRDRGACDDYFHICDIDDAIARLQELRQKAIEYYGDVFQMIININVVHRRGLNITIDGLDLGYFACSGDGAFVLLCTLELLCRTNGCKLIVNHDQVKELKQWISLASASCLTH